jgi:hypothetical protein
MEKVGRRQCTNGATRPYQIPISPMGGSKIQRAQAHACVDRTPRNQTRRETTTSLAQEDAKEERQEIKQRSLTGTRNSVDKFR